MTSTKVLLVDDEAPMVELVRGYLEAEGMDVITTADGPSALDRIRDRSPDVVVLDVNLPGFDGLEPPRWSGLRALLDLNLKLAGIGA